jgi:5-methylcytosine-specific restriction endonuclease McrA
MTAGRGSVSRSERLTMPRPAVIRLTKFIHVPRRFRRQVTNTFLFARDEYSCQYCGRHRSELKGRQFLTRDHILPISRGGENTWANVVTSCSPCNNRKGNHLPEEAGMALLATPSEPNYVHLVWAVRRVTAIQARWIGMFYGKDTVEVLKGRAPKAM